MIKICKIKIKNEDKVTLYQCINRVDKGMIVLPFVRKGKTSCQVLLTSEFNWSKCNRSYIGRPKVHNGKYIVITELSTEHSAKYKGGER